MKQFNVPDLYRSTLIAAVKNSRKLKDKMKKDFSPTLLDFGPIQIFLSRHFGFCYGVENAIDIAFRTIEENPGKRTTMFFYTDWEDGTILWKPWSDDITTTQ